MKPLTREWVEKAEEDYHTAWLLFRARKHPSYAGACFHAQQCAEKYMKAVLQEHVSRFEKTHRLNDLLKKLLAIKPWWQILSLAAQDLDGCAVKFRYPGESADKNTAKKALQACEFIRSQLQEHLGIRQVPGKANNKKKKKTAIRKTAKKSKKTK